MLSNNKTELLTRDFKGKLEAAEFSPRGEFLAVSGPCLRGTAIFDTSQLFSSTARPIAHVDNVAYGRQCLSFSPSGELLAVGHGGHGRRSVVIYKVGGGLAEVWSSAEFPSSAQCFLWLLDHLIVTEEGDWIDLETQTVQRYKFECTLGGIPRLMDIMRNRQLAVISMPNDIHALDLRTRKTINSVTIRHTVNSISTSFDEQLFLASSRSSQGIAVRDIRTWLPVFESAQRTRQARFCFKSQPHLFAVALAPTTPGRMYPTILRGLSRDCLAVQYWNASTGRVQISIDLIDRAITNSVNALTGTGNIFALVSGSWGRGKLHVLTTE